MENECKTKEEIAEAAQESRRALIRSLRGAAAGAPVNVDDFLREKREENTRQEQRYRA